MSWAQELGTPADRLVRTRHNREAATPEAVAELIDWYRARWEIEMLLTEPCFVSPARR